MTISHVELTLSAGGTVVRTVPFSFDNSFTVFVGRDTTQRVQVGLDAGAATVDRVSLTITYNDGRGTKSAERLASVQ